MYPKLGAGGLHVFASAGSPVATRPTGARSRTTSSRSAQLYDGARFFWAVPDYVPADQVAALPGLVRPEVTERMATLIVQGTTPGAGLSTRSEELARSYGLDEVAGATLVPIRDEFFGKKTPAATQVAVSALGRPEWLIEVEAIAVL